MLRRSLPLGVALLLVVGALAPLAALPATAQTTTTLEVVVVDDTGDRLDDATVNASWSGGRESKTTPTNGTVTFAVPRSATVLLSVSHPDFVADESAVASDPTERTRVSFSTSGRLVVTATGNGDRLQNARVTLADGDTVVAEGRTDDDGRFTTDTLPQGTYNLTLTRTGYAGVTESVDVYGRTTQTVQLRRGSIELVVRVADPYFDPAEPVGNATVTYGGFDGDTTTGNGVARLLVPLNSRAPVTVEREGYRTTEQTVSVAEDERVVTVNVSRAPALDASLSADTVSAGESVLVSVRNAYDDPAAGVTVSLDGEQVAETDADGEASVTVPAGEHTLSLSAEGAETTLSVTGEESETETATPIPDTTPTSDTTPTTTTTGPGFGAVVAVLSLAVSAVALLASRRR
jgi:hypothetical protein